MTAEAPQVKIQSIVRQLLTKHSYWRLLNEAELTASVLARSQEVHATSETLTALAVQCYSEMWYHSCKQVGEQREQAFREVGAYLYDRARYFCVDPQNPLAVKEITDDALFRVFTELDQCQGPGTFMGFCFYRLRHAWKAYLRKREQLSRIAPLTADPHTTDDEATEQIPDSAPATTTDVICSELRTQLLQRFAAIYQQASRAHRQLDVVYHAFFEGLSQDAIAAKLATTTANVAVLKNHGLKHLKTDAEFCQLLRDLKSSGCF